MSVHEIQVHLLLCQILATLLCGRKNIIYHIQTLCCVIIPVSVNISIGLVKVPKLCTVDLSRSC